LTERFGLRRRRWQHDEAKQWVSSQWVSFSLSSNKSFRRKVWLDAETPFRQTNLSAGKFGLTQKHHFVKPAGKFGLTQKHHFVKQIFPQESLA